MQVFDEVECNEFIQMFNGRKKKRSSEMLAKRNATLKKKKETLYGISNG